MRIHTQIRVVKFDNLVRTLIGLQWSLSPICDWSACEEQFCDGLVTHINPPQRLSKPQLLDLAADNFDKTFDFF